MMSTSRRSMAQRSSFPYNVVKTRPRPAAILAPVLAETPSAFEKPSLYLNPELSLLQFQRRVLEEARDTRNPLLERVKFLAILSSNLDEFFMVRVAGLLQQIESGIETLSIDGRPPKAQLEAIRAEAISLIDEAYATYQN